MSIALIPLDERPVCMQLPASVARIAGLDCALPPAKALPSIRQPGDPGVLAGWLSDRMGTSGHVVVSLEGLGFGGLIPSRIGSESVSDVLRRWSALDHPGATVYGFSLVPRTPDSLDAMEEPSYWNPHGPALHRLSGALATGEGVDQARDALPEEVRRDWLGRRMRQHTLALAALELTGRSVIDHLVVGIDDASQRSLSATDQEALEGWVERLELGGRALVQPGADEIGAVLVARACLDVLRVRAPRIGVLCAARRRLSGWRPTNRQRCAKPSVDRLNPRARCPTSAAVMAAIIPGDGTPCWWCMPPRLPAPRTPTGPSPRRRATTPRQPPPPRSWCSTPPPPARPSSGSRTCTAPTARTRPSSPPLTSAGRGGS
ncbi:DUF4127 family protein [Arthrobacter crusticola]|uniref:DUF4127 family protein n=1 Tax=Arthrobacter crusticola TaxID=2547960 RepID=A0A4R5TZE6_9MICC|nr:DUF4127 family protein [Arthrobacter crusticola]